MDKIITRETINRLLKDVRMLMKNPLNDQGIYYVHDDTDILQGYAMIIGPSDTPYFGGYYLFKINYPYDYPLNPPKLLYCTNENKVRFHPNLYVCGKVCLSILNTWSGEQWTSCQTISSVLLTLLTIFTENPLLNEPGVNKNHEDIENYNHIITYSNLNSAICSLLMKKESIYFPFFDLFYDVMKENYIKNFNKLNEIAILQNEYFIKLYQDVFENTPETIRVNNKGILTKGKSKKTEVTNSIPNLSKLKIDFIIEDDKIIPIIYTNMYGMCIKIDYSQLIYKLNEVYSLF